MHSVGVDDYCIRRRSHIHTMTTTSTPTNANALEAVPRCHSGVRSMAQRGAGGNGGRQKASATILPRAVESNKSPLTDLPKSPAEKSIGAIAVDSIAPGRENLNSGPDDHRFRPHLESGGELASARAVATGECYRYARGRPAASESRLPGRAAGTNRAVVAEQTVAARLGPRRFRKISPLVNMADSQRINNDTGQLCKLSGAKRQVGH